MNDIRSKHFIPLVAYTLGIGTVASIQLQFFAQPLSFIPYGVIGVGAVIVAVIFEALAMRKDNEYGVCPNCKNEKTPVQVHQDVNTLMKMYYIMERVSQDGGCIRCYIDEARLNKASRH